VRGEKTSHKYTLKELNLMYLKEDHKAVVKKILTFTEDIKELESRRELVDNYQKEYLLFNGNEAQILYTAYRKGNAIKGKKVLRDEWFDKKLNQEFFEQDPFGVISEAKHFSTSQKWGEYCPTKEQGWDEILKWKNLELHFLSVERSWQQSIFFLKKLRLCREHKKFPLVK
tara:strand:+ start:112 stop:624 length:513 start_codon:yes stop_codon:yes gene_type:complete